MIESPNQNLSSLLIFLIHSLSLYIYIQTQRHAFRRLLRSSSGNKRWGENERVSPTTTIMSLSCSDCFSDLLCGEDSSGILSGESPECSTDIESPACSEESIAGFIEDERKFVPGFDYLARFQSRALDISARTDSVAWILKVIISSTPFLPDFSKPDGNLSVITLLPFLIFSIARVHSDLLYTAPASSVMLTCAGSIYLGFVMFDTCVLLFYLQVQTYYGFQPLTAYLSVNYLDRFLDSRRLPVKC